MAEDAVAEVWSFPTDISQFDTDERISFSKADGKYIAVQEDGTEFEFSPGLKRWVLHDDQHDRDTIAAAQLAAYGAAGDSHNYDQSRAGNGGRGGGSGASHGQKRKQDQAYGHEPQEKNGRKQNGSTGNNSGGGPGPVSSNKRARAAQAAPKPKQNTAVYVTCLPPDATVEEVAELFSRKCGVIAEEIDSGRPRIKLYTDADGRFKGDALIVFFKPQSVDMAIMLLDDTEFRFPTAAADRAAPRMRVQAADASYKKTTYTNEAAGEAGSGADASASASAPASRPAPSGPRGRGGGDGRAGANQDKQKIIKKTQKLDAKLADWSSDDERPYGTGADRGGGSRNPKWDKVVILKHMFTLADLEEDPAALLDIKEDIREECAKLGDVTNVVLFDLEPAGYVSVKFKTVEAAEACLRLMNGRAFDGRIVEATLATGREKFKKTKTTGDDSEDSQGE